MTLGETTTTWLGMLFCLTQSAMFSGLNLAFFSVGRLRLEAEAEHGSAAAEKILRLRRDANFLLCTILWGNVSVNVLLALLSESVLAGVGGFIFSTVGITFFGEIMPQAYFSRHAIRIGALLAPVIRFYQWVLFPVAKPAALILDGWIGPEGPTFMREKDIEIILHKHIREQDSEIGSAEGRGALNFLDLDDRLIAQEGAVIDGETIHRFPARLDLPIIPKPNEEGGPEFIERLKTKPHFWHTITNEDGDPCIVIESERYLCNILAQGNDADIYEHSHRPIIIRDPEATLDTVLGELVVEAEHGNDRIIDRDVILYWNGDSRRIITGGDILGRLLQGIARRERSDSLGSGASKSV